MIDWHPAVTEYAWTEPTKMYEEGRLYMPDNFSTVYRLWNG